MEDEAKAKAAVQKDIDEAITAAADIARAAKRISGRRMKKWHALFRRSTEAVKGAFKKSTVARVQWKRVCVQVLLLQEKTASNKWARFSVQITRSFRFKAAVKERRGGEDKFHRFVAILEERLGSVTVRQDECGGKVCVVYTSRIGSVKKVYLDEKASLNEAIEEFKSGKMKKKSVQLQSLFSIEHSKSVFKSAPSAQLQDGAKSIFDDFLDDGNEDDAFDAFVCLSCSTPLKVAKVCSKCKKATYCSVECQKKHWKMHKKVCN